MESGKYLVFPPWKVYPFLIKGIEVRLHPSGKLIWKKRYPTKKMDVYQRVYTFISAKFMCTGPKKYQTVGKGKYTYPEPRVVDLKKIN